MCTPLVPPMRGVWPCCRRAKFWASISNLSSPPAAALGVRMGVANLQHRGQQTWLQNVCHHVLKCHYCDSIVYMMQPITAAYVQCATRGLDWYLQNDAPSCILPYTHQLEGLLAHSNCFPFPQCPRAFPACCASKHADALCSPISVGAHDRCLLTYF